jgi:hypothetical protein
LARMYSTASADGGTRDERNKRNGGSRNVRSHHAKLLNSGVASPYSSGEHTINSPHNKKKPFSLRTHHTTRARSAHPIRTQLPPAAPLTSRTAHSTWASQQGGSGWGRRTARRNTDRGNDQLRIHQNLLQELSRAAPRPLLIPLLACDTDTCKTNQRCISRSVIGVMSMHSQPTSLCMPYF